MPELSSFAVVIALWLGVSVSLWWAHREGQRRKRLRQRQLIARAGETVRDAQAVYDRIRAGDEPEAAAAGDSAEAADGEDENARLRNAATALLRRVQSEGPFFDAARVVGRDLKALLGVDDCAPLTEILQIRRDIWAASEIILIDDAAALGDAFADPGSYQRFCEDARKLLFKGAAEAAGGDDLIDLRLAVARADADAFARDIEAELAALEERERLPTWREIVSYPVAAARAAPGQFRAFRAQVLETADQIRLAARAVRSSPTVAEALDELRRARNQLPGRLQATLERASALARHGRDSIVAHQHVLAKAYDIQTRYQDALQRAPELTERGRQFIARLELARRSEMVRETSKGLADDGRRLLVRGLAHMIAALQRLQSALDADATTPATTQGESMARAEPATTQPLPAPVVPEPSARPRPAPPTSVPPIVDRPEDAATTAARLDALFRSRKSAGAAAKKQQSAAKPSPSPEPQRLPPPAAPPAGKAPARKPLWPSLDRLRQAPPDAVAPPASPVPQERVEKHAEAGTARSSPPIADGPRREKTPSRSSEAVARKSKHTADPRPQATAPTQTARPTAPRRRLFGKSRASEVEIFPPAPKTSTPAENTIAAMLARLRLEELETLELEALGPREPVRRPASLMSKLSEVAPPVSEAPMAKTEAAPPPKPAPAAPPPAGRRLFGFGRKPGG
ncbi:MAG: hypothetical protein NW215_03185 [Hyphomicrobiales bacterium]|nr:hypothetical protein [Hyphomicrobiales bacterium]